MSIYRRMYKEAVVRIQNGILLTHKKEYIWLISNEIDEPWTYYRQSEVSQKEKDKYCILMHIYRI